MSVDFQGISKSPGMIIRPDGLLCSHFLVLDIDPQPGISFSREGRYRFLAFWKGMSWNAKKQFLIPQLI